MSRNDDKQTQPMTDIDALLQDSYLLVVELREGASARNGRDLWKHCSSQIEHVRQRLEDAGMSEKSINHISYAHCALLDETVLRFASEDARADWAGVVDRRDLERTALVAADAAGGSFRQ
jgi:type VI secretion system protein ImpK